MPPIITRGPIDPGDNRMSVEIDPAEHADQVGTTNRIRIGTVTRLMAQRYARAIEDENPLFHDVEYALEQGYDDVVVPPNYLPAIIERTAGRSADELREDGLDPKLFPVELPEGALLMNGGQQLSFDRYVTAGEELYVEETLTDIYQKDSKDMGFLTFLDLVSEYFTTDDERVLKCEETIIVGDRQ